MILTTDMPPPNSQASVQTDDVGQRDMNLELAWIMGMLFIITQTALRSHDNHNSTRNHEK
jgi:hypothetical protein